MATTKTYFISPGGNTIVTGQDLILDGTQQFHTDGTAKVVPTGKHKTIIINDVTPGSWTSGDDFEITNLATNNTFNASFLGLDFTEVNPKAFSGIQLVNLTLGEHNVVVDGGFGTGFLGGPMFNGITTLTLNGSAGGFLTFGSSSLPLEVLLTNIKAQAATATGSGIDINLDPALITPTTAVTFSFSNVGNAGAFSSESDDYVHGSGTVFAAGWGAFDGSTTAATWNISVAGKNFIELFTHGATNTTAVSVSGAGAMTLFGVSDEFANVANIKDTASGVQVITGALQTDGAFKSFTGFLTDNVALTNGGSLSVTSTNSGNFVDLSGFESLGTATIGVAAGTVVLSDDVLLSGAPIVIGTPTNIGYGGDEGDGPGHAGTINWANLPSSANTLTFYHGVEFNGSDSFLSVVNTPNTFTMNLQDEDFHHNDFNITAATPTAGNTFNLELGSNAGTIGVLGATGGTPNDIEDTWTVTGYSTNNIILKGSSDVHLASSGGYFASSGVGDNSVAINIKGALLDGTDVQEMHFGNISNVDLDDYVTFNSFAATAASGVVTHDGTITDTATVFLELGATDASVIDATSGHGLDMEDPGTDIDGTFTVHGSNNNFNNLQGDLGLVINILGVPVPVNNDGAVGGVAGDSIITGGNVADHIWDTGGTETINVHNIHTKIFYSQFQLNSEDDFAFAITGNGLVNGQFFNNAGAGPGVATINGFTPGAANTGWVDFAVDSWGDPSGNYRGLVDGSVNEVSGASHFGVFSIINNTNGDLASNGDVIAYFAGTDFAGAGAVAKAITSTGGAVDFFGTLTAGRTYDILVAFSTLINGVQSTDIADVQFKANTTGSLSTANVGDASGHLLVQLVGVSLGSIEGSVLGSNDVVHFNGA